PYAGFPPLAFRRRAAQRRPLCAARVSPDRAIEGWPVSPRPRRWVAPDRPSGWRRPDSGLADAVPPLRPRRRAHRLSPARRIHAAGPPRPEEAVAPARDGSPPQALPARARAVAW